MSDTVSANRAHGGIQHVVRLGVEDVPRPLVDLVGQLPCAGSAFTKRDVSGSRSRTVVTIM